MFRNKKIVAYSVIIFLLLIAMLPIPSDYYYHFLRIAVTITSVFAFYNLIGKSNLLWIDFAVLTIVFNPFVPLSLGKEIWLLVDVIAILAFVRLILTERKFDNDSISKLRNK